MPHSSSYPPQYGGYQPPGKSPPPDPYGPVDKNGMADLLTPKTVVQLAVWILMFGLGAGLSGLVLFAIYQGQVNNLRSELLESQEQLQETLEERIGSAPDPQESPNLNVSGATPPDPTKQLVQTSAPAIVGVTGKDSSGQTVSGTGFVVNSTDDGTWVLTNNSLVAGVKGFNDLSIRHRNSNLVGEVYETDPGRDLALVIYRVSAERSLRFSRVEAPKEGDQVWALGNTKAAPYAAGIAAKLTSVTSGAIGIDTEVPDSYLGGPIVDADGRVVGVLSKSALSGDAKASAIPINLACSRVLRCPGSGGSRASASPTPGQEPAASPTPDAPPTDVAPETDTIEPPVSNPNTPDVPIG
ncbi:MAG: serine protease [Actinomycetota bacterium]